MPSEAEGAVMAFFFAMRSARKDGPLTPRQERLWEAVLARSKAEALERDAARDAWEAGQG